MSPLRIGYIGLGAMGLPISINLTKYIKSNNLPPMIVWNRSPAKYELLKPHAPDTQFAESVEEVIEKSDIVFSMLIDDKAAEDVFGKAFEYLKGEGQGREVVFVDQSSLKAVTSGALAERASSVGATYLACPVFGRPPMAEASKLLIVFSGPSDIKERVKGVLIPAVGDRVVDVGEDVKKATALKSMGNMVLLGWIQLLSESYALGDGIGIDPEVFNGFLQQFIPAPPLLAYSNLISKGVFKSGSGFSIDGGMKDARNMLALGEDLGHPVSLPTIELAMKNMERSKELGGNDQDWSALAAAVREANGLEPYREGTNNGQGPK
ncbi:hypothetical protein I302_105969 [Kwoniella bestiolae CBS 10118]|uniref:6-phosphogluconate dehydrogenase NADP-binding domain-containing protein n=1 Tax=Kwoniella bestiolae CBS 10118 TaxID=1296100 RepID=A0A1B9G2N1_9TREE|nr:hypothetical protein I302_05093 [Kwoniella bestiolae CBS 10118]OCF25279.1 hypothetical protein I302_05093 [Kwoniella bestiolae CBS 10118]